MEYLKSDRICLRAPEPEDLDVIFKWENDADCWYLGNAVAPISRFVIKKYIEESLHYNPLESKQLKLIIDTKGTCVGCVDLCEIDLLNKKAEVGILIDEKHRRAHYAEEAVNLLIAYAFSFLGLKQIYAYIPTNNEASISLFEKLKFEKTGTLKNWIKKDEQLINVFIYQLII